MNLDDQDKEKALRMASRMADDFDQEHAEEFIGLHEDKSWYSDFMLLYHMLTHPDYSLSPATWAIIAGALAYVIFPVDIIPDFIPVVGWLDDAFVLGTVMVSLRTEIKQFKAFLETVDGQD